MRSSDARESGDLAAWAAIALLALGVALCQWLRPLPVAPDSLVPLVIACGALFGAAWFYRTVRRR